MKPSIPTLTRHAALIALALLFSFSSSYSQTFFGESSNVVDPGNTTTSPLTIVPPASMQAGDLVVIYAHYRNNAGNLTVTTTGGQTWTSETAYSSGNSLTRIFWCRFNGTWGANPGITRSSGTGEAFTAVMHVYRPTSPTSNWVKHAGSSNANVSSAATTVTVTGLTTTVNNTVNVAFWGCENSLTWGALAGAGWSKTGLGAQYRNTGGNDNSITSAYNIRATASAVANVSQTRSAGTVRTLTSIITFAEVAPNDLCANRITLTSSTTCTTTAGSMIGSTVSAITPAAPDCSGGLATYDVWYQFVAQTTNPTITLSNIGAAFAPEARLQLLTNSCSTPTSLFCGTTSINANYLTPGTTYYIRVYGTGTIPTGPGNNFDICITDPVATPPLNDDCANASNLSVANACYNLPGTMAGATPSAIALGGTCAGPLVYDVWYKFSATTTDVTASLSSIGTNFTGARLEILSGTCGSFTSLSCGVSPLSATGLTIGTTYYVRVYSNTAPIPNGNARFSICLQSANAPLVRFGNSYVNVSKKTTGGVVEPGDTLEIRMTINHSNASTMNNLRFVDNIPSRTSMLTGTADSLRVITNEGLTYKRYSLVGGDDAGTYVASPASGQFNVRMNLAFGTSNPGVPPDNTSTNITNTTGTMINTNYPRGGGNLLFATAYRVVVTGAVGDTITIQPAQFIYRTGGSDVTLTGSSYKILISQPLSLCTNSIGVNNAAEFGGTFGTGTTLNRSSDLATPIPGYNFLNDVNAYNNLNDGSYAIVKNMGPRSTTNRNAMFRRDCGTFAYDDPLNCNNRMHGGHWYIDGDHTGTTNAIGNVPPGPTTNSGYMLMVNADYVASNVYVQNITNLCPNTYYEFSAWFRNICPTCGADSLGQSFQGTVTAPLSGYPGVYPNLSFALDGLDYYNTGEIDTVGWLKKGFVFRTGPSQTNATFSIRNNSQGGGGNDWAMDDIAVATCLPTMSYSPTINPNVCETGTIQIADTISSFFRNYTSFKWQRSTDNGLNWADITGVTTLPDTNYFITTYTVPPTHTTLSDSGDLYRVVVATSAANLVNPSCNISDGVNITLSVLNCNPILKTDFLSFNGRLINEYANLSWTTSKEDELSTYIIERSIDEVRFTQIGQIEGYNNMTLDRNQYSFTDPVKLSRKTWYRILMVTSSGKKKYSRVVMLDNSKADFGFGNVINPFSNSLYFDITSRENSKIDVTLIDMSGKPVIHKSYFISSGTNSLSIDNTAAIAQGVYTLKIENKGAIISKRVVKRN